MKKIYKKIIKKFKKSWRWIIATRKRCWIALVILAVFIILSALGIKLLIDKYRHAPEKHVYEVMVQPSNQNPYGSKVKDPSALDAGDVIVVFPEGHQWSASEKDSYLILKMRLSEEEAAKLTEPVTKKIKPKPESGADAEMGKMEPQTETVRARKYRLDIESLGFDIKKFWDNPVQPYPDRVFDSGLIEKR